MNTPQTLPQFESTVTKIEGVTSVQTDQSPAGANIYLSQISYNPRNVKARDIIDHLNDSEFVIDNKVLIQLHKGNELLDNLERKKEIE